MKVSYLSNYKALDIQNWSGSDYYIAKALEKQEVDLSYVYTANRSRKRELKFKALLYNIFGRKYDYSRTNLFARGISEYVKSQIASDTEVIFSPSSIPLSLLETNKPKVFYTDATFAGMIDFYKDFTGLCAETKANGNYLEQMALETSRIAIYASDWAAKTAVDNYNISPEKVKVVPFGANVEHDFMLDTIKEVVQKRSKQECNLIFLGVDWERKGAALAINVAGLLNKQGLKTTLHLVGLQNVPVSNLPEFVVNHGFISKSTESGRSKINSLIASSHFLIGPSIAEAYGLVYCEANSFGVPAVATNVGGIPTIIKDELNGKLFSLSSDEHAYAEYIYNTFNNYEVYKELAYSSHNEFKTRLNWKVAGRAITKLLEEVR